MKPAAALLSLLLLAGPAAAEGPAVAPAAGSAPGRYQFQPFEGGLARLDTATGEIVLCRIDPARMVCDNAAGAAGAAGAPRPGASGDDAEFERALGRMKRVLRTFGDIAREFDRPAPEPSPDRT